jgi:hypothetical protein
VIAVSGLDMTAWDALAKAANCRSPCFSVARSRPFPPTTAMAYGSSVAPSSRPSRTLRTAYGGGLRVVSQFEL